MIIIGICDFICLLLLILFRYKKLIFIQESLSKSLFILSIALFFVKILKVSPHSQFEVHYSQHQQQHQHHK